MTRIRSRLVPVKRGVSKPQAPPSGAPFTDSGSGVLNTTLSRGTGSIIVTRATQAVLQAIERSKVWTWKHQEHREANTRLTRTYGGGF